MTRLHKKSTGNPGLRAERRRAATAKYRLLQYGLSPDTFLALLKAQRYRCAICFSYDSGRRSGAWCVDHDHKTGNVRGLLCHHCNVMLGNADDDPAVFAAAILYLTRH